MDTNETRQDKVEKPHSHFVTPHDVVADPALSTHEKVGALETLEQDARLLAIAAAEGMTDGESSNLHEVLDAKEALELLPTTNAYKVVLRDLMSRQAEGAQDGTKTLIERAIEALTALERATATQASAVAGNPRPGSAAEIAKEVAVEKLDP